MICFSLYSDVPSCPNNVLSIFLSPVGFNQESCVAFNCHFLLAYKVKLVLGPPPLFMTSAISSCRMILNMSHMIPISPIIGDIKFII